MFKAIRAEELKVGQWFKRYSPEECSAEAREVIAVTPTGKQSVKIVTKKFPDRTVRRDTIIWVKEEVSDANDQPVFDLDAEEAAEAAAAVQAVEDEAAALMAREADKKVKEIRRQKAYVLENAQKARDVHHNEEAARDWETMAHAYDIALQILLGQGDWMPLSEEDAIIEATTATIEGLPVEAVEASAQALQESRLAFKPWDWSDEKRVYLMIQAYEAYIDRKLEGGVA